MSVSLQPHGSNNKPCVSIYLLESRNKMSFQLRSSCPEVICKEGVLRNPAKFTRKHLWQSLFFNKVTGLRPATLFKKRLFLLTMVKTFSKSKVDIKVEGRRYNFDNLISKKEKEETCVEKFKNFMG